MQNHELLIKFKKENSNGNKQPKRKGKEKVAENTMAIDVTTMRFLENF